MIDTEVTRLRRLRNTALRARAVAAALNSDPAPRDSAFSRSAASCWRIARVVTGRLRAHPYLSYQRGPSELRGVYDRLSAGLLGAIARYRGQTQQIFAEELRRVARELDDARALTLSPDLSDTLGRSQTQIRRLIKELDVGALNEAGTFNEAGAFNEAGTFNAAGAFNAAGVRDDAGWSNEGGSRRAARIETRAGSVRNDAGDAAGNWPYLAI